MRKIIIGLFAVVIVLSVFLISCKKSDSSSASPEGASVESDQSEEKMLQKNSVINESEKKSEEGEKHVNNCKLVVNGQELSSEHYVYMNHEKHNVELPVLAVMRALGAECTWESETLVRIKYNGKEVDIDISLENFGYEIVPGVNGHTRKVMGDEVIFDVDSFSAYFRNYLRIENVADFENSIVYIDPMEE